MSRSHLWRFVVPAVIGKPLRESWWRRTTGSGKSYGRQYRNRDGELQPVHAAVDIGAPRGSLVIAGIPGIAHRVNHGRALGDHQIMIEIPSTGEGYFFAHMDDWRVEDGQKVEAHTVVGVVGLEGLSSGPHLHFEHLPDWRSWRTIDPDLNPHPELVAAARKELAERDKAPAPPAGGSPTLADVEAGRAVLVVNSKTGRFVTQTSDPDVWKQKMLEVVAAGGKVGGYLRWR